jgi:ketol-acid reductoisomerase
MKKILGEIQSGDFAREWMQENKDGRTNYNKLTEQQLERPIEKIGTELREMMPWI